MKRMGRRTFILLFVAIGALLVGAIIYIVFLLMASQPNASDEKPIIPVPLSQVCTDDMVRRVGQPIADSDIAAIRAVYDEFKDNTAYTGDATCNYIATRYFIAIGNVDEAKTSLNALKYAISAGGTVSMNFTPPAQPTEVLEQVIADIELKKDNGMSKTTAEELNEMDKVAPQQ